MSFQRVILLLFVSLLAFSLFACSGVTETGNPADQPPPEGVLLSPPDGGSDTTLGDTSGTGGTYYNSTYGTYVVYPSGWTGSAPSTSLVEFTGGGDPATTATFTFNQLVGVPQSLLGYLYSKYPGRSFSVYSTGALDGYFYDDPAVDPDGGDLKEYYFLGGATYIEIEAVIFDADEKELDELLSGIYFQ